MLGTGGMGQVYFAERDIDGRTRQVRDPQTRAELLESLADIRQSLGECELAHALANQALQLRMHSPSACDAATISSRASSRRALQMSVAENASRIRRTCRQNLPRTEWSDRLRAHVRGRTMAETEVTQLLLRWRGGEKSAEVALMDAIYPVLRKLAQQRMSAADAQVIAATELVHEAWFRLVDQRETDFQNRAHFYAIAARLIRRVLIDQVRERQAQKRGADFVHVSLNHALDADDAPAIASDDLLDIDRMLQRLERIRARAARIVELRYFAGLSIEEAAESCEVSLATAKREWQFARAWMQDQLGTASG